MTRAGRLTAMNYATRLTPAQLRTLERLLSDFYVWHGTARSQPHVLALLRSVHATMARTEAT
jgi:hypothetical protein